MTNEQRELASYLAKSQVEDHESLEHHDRDEVDDQIRSAADSDRLGEPGGLVRIEGREDSRDRKTRDDSRDRKRSSSRDRKRSVSPRDKRSASPAKRSFSGDRDRD